MSELGRDVWIGGTATPLEDRGITVLGTPVGTQEFVLKQARDRIETELEFLRWIKKIPDLQCAWNLLLYCASPRMNHTLRTLPPDLSADYARNHDAAMRDCLAQLLQRPQISDEASLLMTSLCTMKQSHGGLGLRSAVRTAPAA